MYKKIFRSSFVTVFLVLVLSIVLIMCILSRMFEKQIQLETADEARYISHAVENEGLDYFKKLNTDKRITLIDTDGRVIYDNKTDIAALDNHREREEVRKAMETGKGMSIRYSDTLTRKTLYYALKMSDNRILRVSTDQHTAAAILLHISGPVAVIFVIALMLTAFLSSRVSRAIVRPVNSLDLENPENNVAYEELTPLLRRISEQKKTIAKQLAAAEKSRMEFKLITENMNEGFLVTDRNMNILTYNEAALRILGIDTPKDNNALVLCRAGEFRNAVARSLSGEKSQDTMVRNDRTYSIIANPVYEDKSIIGAVIVLIDITEIEKREELRREFTANVSHELKTPLTSISGFAELMKKGDIPPETVKDFSRSVYDEAQRLISLVNDIIKISELDEKNISLEKKTVDLYKLSEEIIYRLQGEADKKNISLDLTGSSTSVYGVEKIIDEMIYNLCDNAIKYNKKNGRVYITITDDDKKAKVTVRDNGIGIPPEHQSRVFERFYRVDKSHSKRVGGTGLGLAIVKHGALYHNADLTLESTEGKGTSITICFDKAGIK